MSDETYLAFFNSLVMKCPFCAKGQVKLFIMKPEGARIYGQPPEVAECEHLLAYGNFEPAMCKGGLEAFPGIQALVNAPTPETPETVQRVSGQAFSWFCRDANRLLDLAKKLPADAPLSIACPYCPKRYPVPCLEERANVFCEHAFFWQELGSRWTRPELDGEPLNRPCGDNRITGDNVLFSHICRGDLPRELAPVLRSAWAFGEENYNVFAFAREAGQVVALNDYLREQLRPFPARTPRPPKAAAKPGPKPAPKPWWKIW